MDTYTVFFKAQASDGTCFLSSTTVLAENKDDAKVKVMVECPSIREITSVMKGR